MNIELGIIESSQTEAGKKAGKLENVIYAKQLTRQGLVEIAASEPNTYQNIESLPKPTELRKIMLDNYLSNNGWQTCGDTDAIYRTVDEETENTNLEFCRILLEWDEVKPGGIFSKRICDCKLSASCLTKEGWEHDYRVSEPWQEIG